MLYGMLTRRLLEGEFIAISVARNSCNMAQDTQSQIGQLEAEHRKYPNSYVKLQNLLQHWYLYNTTVSARINKLELRDGAMIYGNGPNSKVLMSGHDIPQIFPQYYTDLYKSEMDLSESALEDLFMKLNLTTLDKTEKSLLEHPKVSHKFTPQGQIPWSKRPYIRILLKMCDCYVSLFTPFV